METVSVLLTAFNEGKGISRVLDYLEENSELINDVVIVSDACEDETENIVEKWVAGNRLFPVTMIFNANRQGRAAAIRQGLKSCAQDITVIFACDIKPLGNSFQNLLTYFQDSKVGAVTGHPVLNNGTDTIADCLSHLMWRSHDNVGRKTTLEGTFFHLNGEMYAIRRSALTNFEKYNGLAEDAAIGLCIYRQGYRVMWTENVTYLMQYPSSLKEWLRVRKRCCYGRVELADKMGLKGYPFYELTHLEYMKNILRISLTNWRFTLALPLGALLELVCRLYYVVMYPHISQEREKMLSTLWQPAGETKW